MEIYIQAYKYRIHISYIYIYNYMVAYIYIYTCVCACVDFNGECKYLLALTPGESRAWRGKRFMMSTTGRRWFKRTATAAKSSFAARRPRCDGRSLEGMWRGRWKVVDLQKLFSEVMGNPQVTMGFNTKMVEFGMIWGAHILGNPHKLTYIS